MALRMQIASQASAKVVSLTSGAFKNLKGKKATRFRVRKIKMVLHRFPLR